MEFILGYFFIIFGQNMPGNCVVISFVLYVIILVFVWFEISFIFDILNGYFTSKVSYCSVQEAEL